MAVIAAAIAGCASPTPQPAGQGTQGQNPSQWLGQLALPPGAVMRTEQSLIIGTGDNWVGRVVLEVGRDADAAYRFFLDSYPAQGWTIVSAVRGKTSVIVMTRQERTATLEMTDAGLLGTSTMSMTMAPRNATVLMPKKP